MLPAHWPVPCNNPAAAPGPCVYCSDHNIVTISQTTQIHVCAAAAAHNGGIWGAKAAIAWAAAPKLPHGRARPLSIKPESKSFAITAAGLG